MQINGILMEVVHMRKLVWFLLCLLLLSGCEGINKASLLISEDPKSTAIPGEMVVVEKGGFLMGDTLNIGNPNEKPVHIVNFSYDFHLGKYEVTIKEYNEFCDKTGRVRLYEEFKLDLIPAIAVSWWDAIAYCNWLSTEESLPKAYDSNGNLLDLSGNITTDPSKVAGYRLPTEAEWEYAARGGKYSKGYKYAGSNNKDEVAWHEVNNRDIYHEVGLKLPNELELFDMTGNVWEWCSDGWQMYLDQPVTNPFFVGDSMNRILRGGSLLSDDSGLYLSKRIFDAPDQFYSDVGFRVCRTIIEQDLPYVSKLGGLEGPVLCAENTFAWSGIIMEGEIVNYDYRMDKLEWISCELNDSFTWRNYSRRNHTFEVRAKSKNGIYSRVASWEFFAFEMKRVSSGSFTKGDTFGGGYSEELPTSLVILDYDYNLGEYEVTFDEYDVFCEATGRNKPYDEGWGRGSRPVINITWWDAIAYCNWLSEMASLPKAYNENGDFLDRYGNITSDPSEVVGYRLPTEAEWEFAARGGTESKEFVYAGSENVDHVAWYKENANNMTQAVGILEPNELLIFDLSGNVWEWCSDLFSVYKAQDQVNPFTFNSSSNSRVIRGGSWSNNETYLRVSCRLRREPEDTNNTLGFRICRTDIDIRIPVMGREYGPNGKILEPDVTFVWNGSDYDGLVVSYQYRKDGGEWEELFELKDSYTWWNVSGGSHTFEVRAVDNDGFCSEPVSWFFWRVIEGDKVFVKGDFSSIEEHLVDVNILDHDFTIGRYEVTIAEFQKFCSDTARNMPNVELVSSDSCPVFNVSWRDAIAYCNWLSDREELPRAYNSDGKLLDAEGKVTEDLREVVGYRLPTEAEWEFAARGGAVNNGHKYAGGDDVELVAWYSGNSEVSSGPYTKVKSPKEIGQKLPNELDLFDMSGNVWEWCTDSSKSVRGGSYEDSKSNVMITSRRTKLETRSESIGFRICRTVSNEKQNRDPYTPVNISPLDNAVCQSKTITLIWECDDPDGDVVTYEIYFGEDTKQPPIAIVRGILTYTVINLEPETTYHWKIVAKDEKGASAEGPIGHFRTDTYLSSFKTSKMIPDVVLVEKGSFTMGDYKWGFGDDDEKPTHNVTFTYDFYIGKYETTLSEYLIFCEATNKGKLYWWGEVLSRPVTKVSWENAIEYCNWLSDKEKLPRAYDYNGNLLDKYGRVTTDPSKVVGYRLPTEAEWEYAARGGNKSKEYKYSGSNRVADVAWYNSNSERASQEVGKKAPNELGIYDMSGNVWEWCSDLYGAYSILPQTNPYNSTDSSKRVIRGGSWYDNATSARVANRSYGSSYYSGEGYVLGFRIARTATD